MNIEPSAIGRFFERIRYPRWGIVEGRQAETGNQAMWRLDLENFRAHGDGLAVAGYHTVRIARGHFPGVPARAPEERPGRRGIDEF